MTISFNPSFSGQFSGYFASPGAGMGISFDTSFSHAFNGYFASLEASLADVTFANNLGTITFKRFLLTVADDWEWDGRRVIRRKTISLDGWMSQDVAERIDAVLSPSGQMTGGLGTLTLPWGQVQNVKCVSLEIPDGDWIDLVPVTAQFVDENPNNAIYTADWFGLKLHNPRMALSIPTREARDIYPHALLQQNTIFDPQSIGAGVMRTKSAPGLMEISLTGAITVDGPTLPADLIAKLMQRTNTDATLPTTSEVPSGYPRPFHMSEASPQMANKLPLVNMIVAGGRLAWDVENGVVMVSLNLLAQPQRLVV